MKHQMRYERADSLKWMQHFLNEVSLKSEIRLEVRIWSNHIPDPRGRLFALTDEGERRRGRVAQRRGGGSNQLSGQGRGRAEVEGSEDDKLHAEEEHVGR